MKAKIDMALTRNKDNDRRQEEEAKDSGLLWFLSVVVIGFIARILVFQSFQWFWEFMEADAYELCKNMGSRNQCIDSSS